MSFAAGHDFSFSIVIICNPDLCKSQVYIGKQ